MRCIAVTTSMSEETLQQASPSLIRKEIGNISLQLILDMQATSFSEKKLQSINKNDLSLVGLQGSRRDIVRFGSLGIALSSLVYIFSNRKAMQYTSPKGVWNTLFASNNFLSSQSQGKSQSARVPQIISYISDIESGVAQYVPEFPAKLDWLNTTPLQFKRDLKGKVVLLDFWTYCCINCMHVLPDLDFLEKKYRDKPFTVVGVHSAKFDNEKDLAAIRNAVLRYNITHPVVNDNDMYLWKELGITSWPTFVLLGPNGKILAQISGEGHRKDLDDFVQSALQFYDEKKLLNNDVLPLALEKDSNTRLFSSPLKFPGKLSIDVPNGRLFISDSNHNRIGVAYNPKKNVLYVADTENHALREIDFVNEMVRTLAGNGTKGSDYVGGGKGANQVLNSPWDVCYEPTKEIVYIAMAGQHQLWEHRISDEITKLFSGDGYERNKNGSSSTNTSFAQPSGLSLSSDNLELYVADSESSSVRAVNLITGGSKLLAGGDPLFSDNLFKFGDHDGIGYDALFQHPLGLFCDKDGGIYIADSYNHKIKKLDPLTKQVITLAGTGTAGFKNAEVLLSQLSEPSGIVGVGTGKIFIADTNNNAIRYVDLNDKNPELHTLELKGVPIPSPTAKSLRRLRRRTSSDTQVIKSDDISSMEGNIFLKIVVPEGYHLSKEASSKFDVEIEPQRVVIIEPLDGIFNSAGLASLHFKRTSSSPAMERINCKVYYCKEDEVCLYEGLVFDVPFKQESQVIGPSDITLSITVIPRATVASSIFDS
ncbi:NHL repeat-containing protein 2 [Zostera marina]|uniref:NHL repeat-containing protein 2 n=1 Tax=Zostera marina TaxID=29655 RepID=A0A0K9Q219_ZOSMR|nr:NHL repeat-containing protein 2 [Zostera marina]